mmetsp:Transcript_31780/g.73787  ORF Transcript_31780/g.73787 Transcript_31780/m.73787 type:complete len:171 (+) Transcript_31780:257-769(+)
MLVTRGQMALVPHLPAECPQDVVAAQVDYFKMTNFNTQTYGLCIQKLFAVSATCSECHVALLKGYQGCLSPCSNVPSKCTQPAPTSSWYSGYASLGAAPATTPCLSATGVCLKCNIGFFKDYVRCTGSFPKHRDSYFEFLDETVQSVVDGSITDPVKFGPRILQLAKTWD